MSMKQLANIVAAMENGKVLNYALPGLTSALVGGGSFEFGTVRSFRADRTTHEFITPHSHRFDFVCLVLSGSATNTLFTPAPGGDRYLASRLRPNGLGMGKYRLVPEDTPRYFHAAAATFHEGQVYEMRHDQIHSIRFSKDAHVLFFEGPQLADESVILEPWSNGKRVPTFQVEPWMFEREGAPS